MDAKNAIRAGLKSCAEIVRGYLEDLREEELLVRPVPGCNHIAWQLGHLIAGEHLMMEAIAPGRMPKLPEGFVERHGKEQAALDDPKAFLPKAEYLRLMQEQRAGTLAILEGIKDADLAQPSPERMRSYAPRVVDLLNLQGQHWLMHAGQWAVIRRKLGRPPLY